MKKWKEVTEKGEIAIREREMRESENGKKNGALKEDRRKRRAPINENGKTHVSFCRPFTVAGCDC